MSDRLDKFGENNETSVDFEIALTALIATIVTAIPSNITGIMGLIPKLLAIFLIVLTLVRKMIVMSGVNVKQNLEYTMMLINIFSLVPIFYVIYNISVIISNSFYFELAPISVFFALTCFLIFETVIFHMLVTQDFLDFVYYGTIYRKKESDDSTLGKILGNGTEAYIKRKIEVNVPEGYVSGTLSEELDLDGELPPWPSFKVVSSKILTFSVLVGGIIHFLTLFSVAKLIVYVATVLTVLAGLVPLQIWYVNYGLAGFSSLFDAKYYLAMALPGILYLMFLLHL